MSSPSLNPLLNPEYLRLARSKLRSRGLVTILLVAVVFNGGVISVFQFLLASSTFKIGWVDCYTAQLGILGFGASYYSLILACQNIAMEREKFTFDFQRMVAMGPWRLAIGKLFGCACDSLLLTLMCLVCTIPAAVLGGVSALNWFLIAVVVITTILLFIALGLASSSLAQRAQGAVGTGFLVALALMALVTNVSFSLGSFLSAINPVMLVRMYANEARNGAQVPSAYLFGLPLPMIAAFLLVYGLLIYGLLSVVARKITDDEFSMLSTRHAAILFGAAHFLMFGILASETNTPQPQVLFFAYCLANMLLLSLYALMLMPSCDLLVGRLSRARPGEHWRVLFERTSRFHDAPPVLTLLFFCAASLLFATPPTLYGLHAGWFGFNAVAALLMALVAVPLASVACMLTLHLYLDKNGAWGSAMILFFAHIVPIPVLLFLAPEKVVAVSPGFWIEWMLRDDYYRSEVSLWLCPILWVSMAILFTLLAAMRMRFRLDFHALQSRAQPTDVAGSTP